MKISRLAAIILTLTVPFTAHGDEHVWILGGGPDLKNSQVSIELNVKWIREVVLRHSTTSQLRIYFTDGHLPTKDVVAWRAPNESMSTLQPLARVFGAQQYNGYQYHSHTVPGVAGGTNSKELVAALRNEFSKIQPGDRALIIFNGHGTYDASDSANNAMRLWGNSTLTVKELVSLLAQVEPSAEMRIFLPQCFSGGFYRLMYQDASNDRVLAKQNRCGFMSVAGNKEAEGCTSGINVGDYRDYSTFFFSALDGKSRLGVKLEAEPDLDGDGQVTLREAHYYSLVYGVSTDLPRTTSEVYLEQWEPWYLRWLIQSSDPDNIYSRLAHVLTARQSYPASGGEKIEDIKARQKALGTQISTLTAEQKHLKNDIKTLQDRIRAEVVARWPEAQYPYTDRYRRFLQTAAVNAQHYIVNHPAYDELVKLQGRDVKLDAEKLTAQRELAQLDKIFRLRRLARILDYFERFANADERAAYNRLVNCESSPL